MPGLGNRGVLLAAIGAALLFAITSMAMRLPKPMGVNAPLSVFSAERAVGTLKDVLGDGAPHPIGSAANAKVRDIIVSKLSALGYKVELQSGWACNPRSGCGYPTNIIATLEVSKHAEPLHNDAVLLAAHYDSVAAGAGASDDGVGVAAALEIARMMVDGGAFTARHPVVILISDGEEGGLLGALLFVREHPLAKKIKAAVNMDSRGTSGLSLMFETGAANHWLMQMYSRSIERPFTNSFYYVIYKLLPSDTDFSVFKAAGYQGFNFAFIGNVGFYHTPLDNLRHTSQRTIQAQGDNALQALRALANADFLDPPSADAVFFDILGHALVVWPAKPIVGAMLCLMILSCGAVAILVRRGRARVREVLWGLIGFSASLLLGALVSVAALGLLFAVGKAPPFLAGPWLAHPAPMSVAAVAAAIFTVGVISTWLSKSAGYWGLWCGGILGMSAVFVVIALWNPGPAFPGMLAVAAALIGLVPAFFTRKTQPVSRLALESAALFPGLLFLALLLPMLLLLYQGLGAVAWPLTSIALCMAGTFLMPLLAIASPRWRHALLWCSGGIALGGLLVTLVLPTFSARWPQRINVEYWLDADTGRAHWWVQPGSLHLPAAMAAVANFGPALQPQFPGFSALGFSAPAPVIESEASQFEVKATGGAHFELRLRPPREADKIVVVFPPTAHVNDAVLNTPTSPVAARLQPLADGATALLISNAPAAGITIGIDSQAPFTALVLDESYGLPGDLPQGKALELARPENATSTQDGDVTVIGRTVR